MWKLSQDSQCGIYFPPEMLAQVKGETPPRPTAAFDMDHTIIRPTGGKVRPSSLDDWEWNWDQRDPIPLARLRRVAKTHNLVLFSNQSGLKSGDDIGAFCTGKIRFVAEGLGQLGIPAAVMVASGHTKYRKPKTAMWDLYNELGKGKSLFPRPLFYVGDAAGRPKTPHHAKDHSACDLKFALNLRVPFLTPQVFFGMSPAEITGLLGGRAVRIPRDYPEPRDPSRAQIDLWRASEPKEPVLDAGLIAIVRMTETGLQGGQLFITVGCPGAGKTAWAKKACELSHKIGRADTVRYSQDDTLSAAKCQAATRAALAEGRRVIVDNTNRDVKTRALYLAMARGFKIPIVCVYIETTRDLSFHLDALRVDHPNPEHRKHKRLPPQAIHGFHKNLEPPRPEEGFTNVVTIPFTYDSRITPAEHFRKFHY